MPIDLPPAPRRLANVPFKSSGEDRLEISSDAQMTDTTMIWHATGDRTNGSCQVAEIIWRAPDASLHHIHELEDEGFFVIEGSLTLHGADGDIELGPGEFGWGPRGHRHGYTVGPDGARVLLIQTPGTQLDRFFKDGNEAPPEGLTTDPAVLVAFGEWAYENYGLTFLDPVTNPPGSVVAATTA